MGLWGLGQARGDLRSPVFQRWAHAQTRRDPARQRVLSSWVRSPHFEAPVKLHHNIKEMGSNSGRRFTPQLKPQDSRPQAQVLG